jgi:hypothetical protein
MTVGTSPPKAPKPTAQKKQTAIAFLSTTGNNIFSMFLSTVFWVVHRKEQINVNGSVPHNRILSFSSRIARQVRQETRHAYVEALGNLAQGHCRFLAQPPELLATCLRTHPIGGPVSDERFRRRDK